MFEKPIPLPRGCLEDISHLVPEFEKIPSDFKNEKNTWVQFQTAWFFHGITDMVVTGKIGINRAVALRHLSVVQASPHLKYEHRQAAVAYLASRWLERWETRFLGL